MEPKREINWSAFKVWVVIVNNFPLDPTRQSIHIYETQHDAEKAASSWVSQNTSAYATETTLIQLLSTLASSGKFYHLDWLYAERAEDKA